MTLLQQYHYLDNRIIKLNAGFERAMKIENLDSAILSINITAQIMVLETERREVKNELIKEWR